MGFYLAGTFIPYYGLCIVIGIACAFCLSFLLCKKLSLDFDDCIVIWAYIIAFGFAGAKLLYIAVSYKEIDFGRLFHDGKYLNNVIGSGFVFYGGLAGGLLSLLFVKAVHKIPVESYLSVLTPCVSLAHGFGRVGCSLAGCCHGKVTHGGFCFIYTHSIAAPNNVPLVPVQGIEAACLFLFTILFVVLLLCVPRKISIVRLYICMYAVLRFILEFFRGDTERGFIGVLSVSQVISIVMLCGAAASYLMQRRKPAT